MRSLQFAIFACALFVLASCQLIPGGGSALVGKPAPPIDLETLGGGRFRLADYKNRDVVMVDIWATWCGPCRMELPILAEVAAKYRSRDVVLCAVNLREARQKVADFIKGEKFKVLVGLDEKGSVADAYHVNGIPMLLVIDKAGIVRFVHVGFRSDLKAKLQSEIDSLLSANSVASNAGDQRIQSGTSRQEISDRGLRLNSSIQ
jgi:thiol-disulfide isomerase/thioredoxin